MNPYQSPIAKNKPSEWLVLKQNQMILLTIAIATWVSTLVVEAVGSYRISILSPGTPIFLAYIVLLFAINPVLNVVLLATSIKIWSFVKAYHALHKADVEYSKELSESIRYLLICSWPKFKKGK